MRSKGFLLERTQSRASKLGEKQGGRPASDALQPAMLHYRRTPACRRIGSASLELFDSQCRPSAKDWWSEMLMKVLPIRCDSILPVHRRFFLHWAAWREMRDQSLGQECCRVPTRWWAIRLLGRKSVRDEELKTIATRAVSRGF